MIFSSRTKRAQRRAIEWLARLESSEHNSDDEARFFDWLEQSPLHQAAYIDAENLWQKGAVLNAPSCQRVRESHKSRGLSDLLTWQPIAACATLCVCAVLFAVFTSQAPPNEYQIQTALGEQKRVKLDDGSEVTLNTQSHITVRYDANQRRVKLHYGQVIFDVKRDPQRPFEVVTREGGVRVLGTKFSVFDAHDKVEVTVLHGRVGIAPLSNPTATEAHSALHETSVTLEANQQLSIAEADQGLSPRMVDVNAATAWQNGRLIYRGTALAEVVADINRYYPTQLEVGDSALAQRKVVAVIKLESFEQTLSALLSTLQLSSTKSEDGQRVFLLPTP